MSAPTLTTARLRLRQWHADDRAAFARLNADPRVMEHFPAPLTREESDALLDRLATNLEIHGFGLRAVERMSDERLLGFAGLTRLTREDFPATFTPCVELALRFDHDAWGHGYATEAARAVLEHGFDAMGLDEILSFAVPANRRSIAVMRRLGMTHDRADDFDHPGLPPGHRLRHHVLYRMTADRWRALDAAVRRGDHD